MKWVKWIELAFAGWIFFSPWVLGFSELIPALWSCMISGIVIGVIVAWELFGEPNEMSPPSGGPPTLPLS